MTKARRISTLVALVAIATGVVGMLAAHGQSEPTSFEATATAEGVRIGVAAPAFLIVDTLADVGTPVAQSTVDGLGNSKAFASNPYPGDLAISGPGLFAGVTGLPNPGEYPLYVASSFPTKREANFSQPNYELSAKSTEQSSEAVAAAGGSAADSSIASAKATAASKRDPSSGLVSAEAVSTADIVNLPGGTLRVGAVRATAKVTRKPGGQPTRSSSLSVDSVSVAGQSVGFSDKGLVLAGTNTPIPEDNPLAAVLEQANISVRYLKAVSNPDGVVSPGLVITQEQQVPQGPKVVVTYVFGRAIAHATAVGGTTNATEGLPAIGGEEPATGADDAPGADGGTAPASSVGDQPAIGGGTAADSSGTTASAAPEAIDTRGGRVTPTRASKGGASTASIYLILVIGGVIGLAGGQLLRMMGVRMAWTS